jgi:hypothetical protein
MPYYYTVDPVDIVEGGAFGNGILADNIIEDISSRASGKMSFLVKTDSGAFTKVEQNIQRINSSVKDENDNKLTVTFVRGTWTVYVPIQCFNDAAKLDLKWYGHMRVQTVYNFPPGIPWTDLRDELVKLVAQTVQLHTLAVPTETATSALVYWAQGIPYGFGT